jgi:hypothetical protein
MTHNKKTNTLSALLPFPSGPDWLRVGQRGYLKMLARLGRVLGRDRQFSPVIESHRGNVLNQSEFQNATLDGSRRFLVCPFLWY